MSASEIKRKLGLYDSDRKAGSPAASALASGVPAAPPSPAHIPGAPASDARQAAGRHSGSLHFGGLQFAPLAPGVFRYRQQSADVRLGRCSLSDYLPFRLSGILDLALWPGPEALHAEDVLFLDTETTGLTRGTGTLPFLTGLASFRSNRLERELIFMAEPGSEESYLDYLQSVFRRFKYLVSYNGRAFDVPLLRNRLILNRKAGLPEFLHFDLLHIFRRLLPKNGPKQGGKGYRQMDLEERLLDYRREDDLPGALIPQIYFDYVRYGHDGGMQKVFEHNLRDLSGMVLLFLEAIRIYDGRADACGALRAGLARILLRNRREEEALELLEGHVLADQGGVSVDEGRASIGEERAPAEDDLPGGLRYRDLLLLAHLYRARGRFAQAAEMFARVVERYDCPYARMSLAKLLEHRLKNFAGALWQTEQLLEKFVPAGNPEAAGGTGLYSRLELEKRRARIHRKIAN